jgi:hypothetical protein
MKACVESREGLADKALFGEKVLVPHVIDSE